MFSNFFRRSTVRITNDVLSVIVIGLAIYILATPFLPQVTYAIEKRTDDTRGFVYDSSAARERADSLDIDIDKLEPFPEENRLVIPEILVDGQIYENESSDVLDWGIWRRPRSSTPDQGGNTVIVAHRYQYTSGPETFYHLDKMDLGDEFFVFWNGKEYIYEVTDTSIVSPDTISIEENTTEPIVTLYTCTPLWTAENRLVVVGALREVNDPVVGANDNE